MSFKQIKLELMHCTAPYKILNQTKFTSGTERLTLISPRFISANGKFSHEGEILAEFLKCFNTNTLNSDKSLQKLRSSSFWTTT